MSKNEQLPSWDLTNVYPGLDSEEFAADNQKFIALVDKLEKYLEANHVHPDAELTETDPAKLAQTIKGFIQQANEILLVAGTLQSYIYSFITTDSYNQEAAKALSLLQPVMVKAQLLGDVLFKGWLAKVKDQIDEVIAKDDL
ncbi:MAG: hypothetical protein ACK2T7_05240, partial [Anaerolineales bacterium]